MKTLSILMIAGLAALSMGCTRISTGELGLRHSFSGQIQDSVATTGFEMTVFESVTVIDATQARVLANDIRAKDVDGVLFSDIDVQATYNIKESGEVAFYKKTKEIDCVKQNDGSPCENVLGFNLVKQELVNATAKAITKFKASDVNTNKIAIEEELKKILTEKLEARFAGAFEVTNVNINSAQLDASVERVLQAQALLDSEKRLMSAKLEIQNQQTELLRREMAEMKEIASKSGVKVGEVMTFRNDKERNRLLSEFAKNNSATTQI